VRAVLADRQSVEQAGKARGAESERELRWWAGLFQRCLRVHAVELGFASHSLMRRRSGPAQLTGDGIPDLSDPSMHADAGDLSRALNDRDSDLRRGRPNGRD
jgi:hypothetical protein